MIADQSLSSSPLPSDVSAVAALCVAINIAFGNFPSPLAISGSSM